jgi:hypothetical protein
MKSESNILPTDGFMRQENNPGAVINVDNSALAAYKKKKEAELRKVNDINNLREEITDIKSMLSQILEKINK